jgi:hypothetical protein
MTTSAAGSMRGRIRAGVGVTALAEEIADTFFSLCFIWFNLIFMTSTDY